jgi:hypothetical protein
MKQITKVANSEIAYSLLEELRKDLRMQGALFLEIGRILKDFRDKKLYEPLSYDTWTQFLGSDELSLKPSTVSAYIQIYEVYVLRFQFPQEELVLIPYDKLRIALPAITKTKTKEEAEDWLYKAKSLSRSDILKERGLMTEEGKPIGWSMQIHLKPCEVCSKWKLPDNIEYCDCKDE